MIIQIIKEINFCIQVIHKELRLYLGIGIKRKIK